MKRILSLFLSCLSLNLAASQISNWTTPPDMISTLNIDASDPHVGIDSNGNATAVWLEGDAVVSRTLPEGGSWSSSSLLAASGASEPQLVVDPAGNATAVWTQNGFIVTATQPVGSTWGSSIALSGSVSSSPHICVDPSGNLVAVWVTSGVVQSATQLFGGSWSATPDVLSSTGSAAPQVAISAEGTVMCVWHTLNGVSTINNVNTANKMLGGSWSVASLVSNSAQDSVYPQIALDPQGNAAVIWYTYNLSGTVYTNVILQAASYPFGHGWSTPVNVSAAGQVNPANLVSQIILNANSHALAVWTNSYDGTTLTIESAASNLQQTWTQLQQLDRSTYDYNINMSSNTIGDISAAYMTLDPNTSSLAIQYLESTTKGLDDGSWSLPTTLSTGTPNAFPTIASTLNQSANLYAIAAWVNNNGTNNNIQAAFGNGTIIMAPSNPMISPTTNNFGVFTEYSNLISWTASQDPNLLGYVVYRNGTQIASISAGTTTLVDNNRALGISDTYAITAYDPQGNESSPIQVSYP